MREAIGPTVLIEEHPVYLPQLEWAASSSPSRSPERHAHRRTERRRRRGPKEFKEGSKSVKFMTFNGYYAQPENAMQLIRQFDVAFGIEEFYEPSKLRVVSLHLTEAASITARSYCTQALESF